MNQLKDFIIHFKGLSVGNHRFEFDINHKFFEYFEHSIIQQGNIKVAINLTKDERMMTFEINGTGEVEVNCDRCCDTFLLPLSFNEHLFLKYGDQHQEESDEVIIITENEQSFDISSYIYEYIHLALPTKIVHPDDENGNATCNPEMLQILEKHNGEHEKDSCWTILEQIKETLNN